MKITFLTLMVLGISTSSFARELPDDPSISSFARGIICRAIDTKYPNTLEGSNGRPGWLVCRVEAALRKYTSFGTLAVTGEPMPSLLAIPVMA